MPVISEERRFCSGVKIKRVFKDVADATDNLKSKMAGKDLGE